MYSNSNKNIQKIFVISLIVIFVSHSITSLNIHIASKKPTRSGPSIWIHHFLGYDTEEKGYFKKDEQRRPSENTKERILEILLEGPRSLGEITDLVQIQKVLSGLI